MHNSIFKFVFTGCLFFGSLLLEKSFANCQENESKATRQSKPDDQYQGNKKGQFIKGHLVLPEGVRADLQNAVIRYESVDGIINESRHTKANADGSFSLMTKATQIGLFVYTLDGKASYYGWVDKPADGFELVLQPTSDFQGQVLGADGQPEERRTIAMSFPMISKAPDSENLMFSMERYTALTNSEGKYTLKGLPTYLCLSIDIRADENGNGFKHVGKVYLEPSENRPLTVTHISENNEPETFSMQRWYQGGLRDCQLCKFRMMVISRSNSEACRDFVNNNLLFNRQNKNVARFMHLELQSNRVGNSEEDISFAKSMNWPFPESDCVFVCIYDVDGLELHRGLIDVSNEDAAEQTKSLVDTFALPAEDARKKWDEAFALAKKSNRKVCARITGRYCGPCFLLARWLDDQRELLAKDYVMLKIDADLDEYGSEVAQRLLNDRSLGIPFFGIFDADENLLVDSDGPLGNLGFPSSFEGKRHLRRMLEQTRTRLNDEQIDQLISSIK